VSDGADRDDEIGEASAERDEPEDVQPEDVEAEDVGPEDDDQPDGDQPEEDQPAQGDDFNQNGDGTPGDGDGGESEGDDEGAGEPDAGSEDPPSDDAPSPEDVAPPADPASRGLFGFRAFDAQDVGATVYLPDGQGPFPVVVLSHGFQLSAGDYASYGEHLASWGFVAVLPQLPGGLFNAPTHTELKDHLASVLDWIEGAPAALGGVADLTRLGLAGHSMGGKISLLLATEDDRPDAVFGIDPVDSAPPMGGAAEDYPSVTPELMASIEVPILVVGELQNAEAMFGPACAPSGENFQAYYEAAAGPVMEVEIVGASHMSFLDNPLCLACLFCPAGHDDPAVTRSLTRELMTAFFESELKGAAWPESWLAGEELEAMVAEGLVVARSKQGF
jgi:chlorophyllase